MITGADGVPGQTIALSNGKRMRWLAGAGCWQYRQDGITLWPQPTIIDLAYTTGRSGAEPQRFPTLADALAWADYIDGMIVNALFGYPEPERPEVEPF